MIYANRLYIFSVHSSIGRSNMIFLASILGKVKASLQKFIHAFFFSGYVFCLPERDSEGRRVVFSKARVLDPSRYIITSPLVLHTTNYLIA